MSSPALCPVTGPDTRTTSPVGVISMTPIHTGAPAARPGPRHERSRDLVVEGRETSTLAATASAEREKAPMRALWIVAAVIGCAVLIFVHTSLLGIVFGIALLGLAAWLYWRPLPYRAGLIHK